MKRKMLIAMTLVFIMLLNCILPIVQVRAADADVGITLNGNLYKAVKANLQRLGVQASYNDAQRTLKASQEALDSVTTLNLSNFAIKDLTGLEIFKNVTSIDLSANKLTEESNLEVLNNFSLEFLDISSNEISDVSMITGIDSIPKMNLHNQKFNHVEIIEVDDSEESNQIASATFKLPQILTYATDDGIIDPDWLPEDKEDGGPYVNWRVFNGVEVEIITANKGADYFEPLYGMTVLRIRVTDPTNTLYNSDINLFYITVSSEERGIIFKDKNLYKAVKEQLTKDQDINEDLYPTTDERNLYERAYDEPMVLVIKIDDIINNIPSLKLADKKIVDLTGIEKFVGLEKELDVSYNYIEDISKIIKLKEEKIAEETKLRQRFEKQRTLIKEIMDKMEEQKKIIKDSEEEIKKIDEELDKLVLDYANATDDAKKDAIQKQIDSKNEEKKNVTIEKQAAEDKFESYKPILEERMEKLYNIYEKEYLLTNLLTLDLTKQTKKEFEDMTKDEAKSKLDEQYTRMGNLEKSLTTYEKAAIISIFNIPTTTSTEVEIKQPDGTTTTETVVKDIENPIKTYFDDLKEFTKDADLGYLKSEIREMKYLAEAFKMVNYCFIERLYEGTTDCLAESYLADQIARKEIDGEDTTILVEIQNNLADFMTILNDAGYNCDGAVTFANNFDDVYALAGRFVNASSEEINEYIGIPQLKYLDISGNLIESIEGIDTLTELKGLYAGDNEICDITKINWSAMTNLLELDLSFNDISDIKPLEVIQKLQKLSVAKNLLEGAFDFNFSGMPDLHYFDLSENRIDDIKYLRNQLIYVARGEGYDDISGYLKAGRFDIRLYNQNLTMSVDLTNETPLTYIELPNIFRQAEELDYDRTAFAVNSILGNVTNDGKEVILDTSKTGMQQAGVYITTGTYDGDNDLGIAYGTTCTIYYNVTEAVLEPEEPDNTVNNTVDNNINNTVDNTVNNTVDNNVNNTVDNTVNNTVDNNVNNTVDNNVDNTVDNNVDGDNLVLGYETKDDYVINVSPNTSLKDFTDKLIKDKKVEVKSNGEVVEDGNIATAMIAVIYDENNEVINAYEVVVKGDVNGDGLADAVDSTLIKAHRAEVTLLTGAYAEAGDINRDGIIDAIDARLLLYHRAEVPGYIL